MRVLDWNVHKKNKSFKDARAFIKSGDYDIVCLQEVPAEEVDAFAELYPHVHTASEFLNFKERVDNLKLVILSRYPFEVEKVVRHQPPKKEVKRYKEFYVDFHYVDIVVNKQKLRIFNVHFKCVAGPHYRIGQLKEVVDHLSSEFEPVICGDFNTFGRPLINIFVGLFFGYKRKEVNVTEKHIFEAFFELYDLRNVFEHTITFTKFPLQLDYILIPKAFTLIQKKVFKKPYGSDHFPIEVEIEI